MEELKSNRKEHVIVFSKVIKAGKRVYYLDVKQNRSGELFLTITESKRKTTEDDNDSQVQYEKHKIFLYQEDFDKFKDGFAEALGYINSWNASHPDEYRRQIKLHNSIKKNNSNEINQTRTDEGQTDDFSFDNSKYNVEMDF